MFFGLSFLVKKVFKITKTSNALSFIGSFLILATVICAGYFKLLGKGFSLAGEYMHLFLATAFLIESIVLIIRKTIISSKRYTIPLIFVLLTVFECAMQLSSHVILSFSVVSLVLLIISIFKSILFDNTTEFNIFNYVVTAFLTYLFLIFCVTQLFGENILIKKFALIAMLISLSVNVIINLKGKNNTLSVLSIVYESVLTFWFILFTKSILTSSFALIASGLIMYIIYYAANNKYTSITSLTISYIQGFFGILLLCFDKDFCLAVPISSFIYIILTMISSLKKDNVNILNTIFEPIFLIMFAVGILIQPSIINSVKPIDVIMVLNVCLLIAMISSTILNRNIKYGYFIMLLLGLFVQIIAAYYSNVLYVVIALLVNLVLIGYTFISKDKFYKKSNLALTLLFMLNALVGLIRYPIWCAVVLFVFLVALAFIFKDKNKKMMLYASLVSVPLIILVNNVNLDRLVAEDISLLIFVPFFLLFSRNIIDDKKETVNNIIELIVLSSVIISGNSDVFFIVILLILYAFVYLLKITNNDKSSKCYLNYLVFATFVALLCFESSKLGVLFMILTLGILLLNNVLYRIWYYKRNVVFEIFHVLFSIISFMSIMGHININFILDSILSIIFIYILYNLYNNERIRDLSLCFVLYPIFTITDKINIYMVSEIVKTFSVLIPISIVLRKVIKTDNALSSTFEMVISSFMYISFIFNVHLEVGLTLGLISIIFIVIGTTLKHKSYSYVGYISLVLTAIIQTSRLWSSIPWWVYLLLTGIILISVAAIKESKKKDN